MSNNAKNDPNHDRKITGQCQWHCQDHKTTSRKTTFLDKVKADEHSWHPVTVQNPMTCRDGRGYGNMGMSHSLSFLDQ